MKFTTAAVVFIAGSASAFAPQFSSPHPKTSLNGILSKETGQSQLDPAVIDRYSSLPFPADQILAEYVWVDAVGSTRSKTRTLDAKKVCDSFSVC